MTGTQTLACGVNTAGITVMAGHDGTGDAASFSAVPEPGPAPQARHPLLWRDHASCANTDPEAFFPENGLGYLERRAKAVRICMRVCPVRDACLADTLRAEAGLAAESRFGIFGGLTPKQRAALDAAPRRGYPQESCPFPGWGRGVERHHTFATDPCPPCAAYIADRDLAYTQDRRSA